MLKHLSVEVTGDWELKSDKKWVTFALTQIIDNAIKYSKDNGKIIIRISQASIEISDDGSGILEEDLPRIFEEGFTGFNGHEHQKATGLGLYMTKQVLDSLSLDINIQSQIDQGTHVLITPKKR
ncbi:Two-component system histidine kinase [Streptococcus lutetiensis]|nr:Two-component system histidine kinase [Streptococcus lutetiensis]